MPSQRATQDGANGIGKIPLLGPIANDPILFYLSPLQLWAGRLVTRVNKARTMEDGWFPTFSHASAHLRQVFSRLQRDHGATAAFLCQWEIGGMVLLGGILQLGYMAAALTTPIVLRELLRDASNPSLAWLLIFLSIAQIMLSGARMQIGRVQGVYIMTMIRTCVFQKSLRLSPAARILNPPAKILNISASDAQALGVYFMNVHQIWSSPAQIVLIAVLSAAIMGPSALFGYVVLFVMFTLLSYTSRLARGFLQRYIRLNDGRLGRLREMLGNIKGVKALSYEDTFRKLVSAVRDEQRAVLRLYLVFGYALNTAISNSIPPDTACAAFLAYYLTGHSLSPEVVFPALAYFNLLYGPLFTASQAISRQFSTWPSWVRIRELMEAEESELCISQPIEDTGDIAISFQGAEFVYARSYSDNEAVSPLKLQVGDLDIAIGKLTMVLGPTGSGKSSLLQAVLNEMVPTCGSCSIYGTLGYVGQDAWVISGTLRDNIVFMEEYDSARYQDILRKCGLDQDLRSFPEADMVQVGDAGNNLSGGQRARIALARALYADVDILLLDDPLSAVDGKVRRQLFDTIRSLEKTIILITLHLHYLPQTDDAVVLSNNKVAWAGPTMELLENTELRERFIGKHVGEKSEEEQRNAEFDDPKDSADVESPQMVPAANLIDEEERADGAVKSSVFKFYAKAAGGLIGSLGVGAMALVLTGFKIITSYWLVWWIEVSLGLTQSQYIGIYLGINAGLSVVTALLGLALVFGSIRASKIVHNTIVGNLLTVPLAFFQRQPIGRILNRLSSDVKSLDLSVLNALDAIFYAGTSLLASICVIATSSPIMIASIFPYMLLTFWYLSQYRVTARELQRSISLLQSPLTAILSESLSSPASIKAYNAVDFLVAKHGRALDMVMAASISQGAVNNWMTVRGELVSITMVLGVALLMTYGGISSVVGGLAVSLASTLTNNVYLMAWAVTDLEIQMNAIERLKTYHDHIPREGVAVGEAEQTVTETWPESGELTLRNVTLRYPSRPTPALDKVNLVIPGGQRVGIAGRTGSGKSTLISSIARLVDVTGGNICLDGLDISTVQPQRVRRDVHTLPQEPLIIEGTLRDNLDPDSHHTDDELLDALAKCHIDAFFLQRYDGGNPLAQEISAGGLDLSAGQRQLLCAARLLLSHPTVLLVDEAAANVDHASDAVLQLALQRLSSETTIIMVAHRAASLAWLDRILVLDEGRIIEDGTPAALLEQHGSYYRQAVKHEGQAVFQHALDIARSSPRPQTRSTSWR